MQLRKFRWSKVYESSEEELTTLLTSRKIKAGRTHAEEHATVQHQALARDSTLWCAEGSLYIAADGNNAPLQPGDAVQIPANTAYTIDAGISGCVYYLSR